VDYFKKQIPVISKGNSPGTMGEMKLSQELGIPFFEVPALCG
jgi:hypothetical protein